MGKKTVRRMTQGELIAAHELLKQHLESSGDFWVYKDNWDDDKIGKAVALDLGAVHVNNLRMNIFGKLKSSSAENVKAEVAKLKAQYEELQIKHNKLCEALSTNRVLDVRYLMVK